MRSMPNPSIILGAVAASVLLAAGAALSQTAPAAAPRTPVIVELFTAEGCSSCPPADNLLAALERIQPIDGVEVIALGEHVDYWDQYGWQDRFSSGAYTARQHDYGDKLRVPEPYTPQMIVDGTSQFNGTDAAAARRALDAAAHKPHLTLALTSPTVDGRAVQAAVSFTGTPPGKPNARIDLYAALVQPSATTDVANGENKGHTLHHVAIVRTLTRIGTLGELAAGPKTFTLQPPKDTPTAGFRIVVFAQLPGPGAIVGSATAALPAP